MFWMMMLRSCITIARASLRMSAAFASPEIEQITHKLDAAQKALPAEAEARRTAWKEEMKRIFDENPVTDKTTGAQ